jgi:hypothetical protein
MIAPSPGAVASPGHMDIGVLKLQSLSMTSATTMMATTAAVRIFTLLVGTPDVSIRHSGAAIPRFCYTCTYASDIDIRVAVALRAGRGILGDKANSGR